MSEPITLPELIAAIEDMICTYSVQSRATVTDCYFMDCEILEHLIRLTNDQADGHNAYGDGDPLPHLTLK